MTYTVSIREFRNGKVVETQYYANPFVAPAWRSQWVQQIVWKTPVGFLRKKVIANVQRDTCKESVG